MIPERMMRTLANAIREHPWGLARLYVNGELSFIRTYWWFHRPGGRIWFDVDHDPVKVRRTRLQIYSAVDALAVLVRLRPEIAARILFQKARKGQLIPVSSCRDGLQVRTLWAPIRGSVAHSGVGLLTVKEHNGIVAMEPCLVVNAGGQFLSLDVRDVFNGSVEIKESWLCC